MVQSKKKETDSISVEKAPGSKATDEARKGRRTAYIIASVVVIVILIVVGVFYYQEYVAPYRITIIKVDDTSVKMGYFIKRADLAAADPFTMLTVLTNEQIIKLEAPQYIGDVTQEDIDQALREIARGGSETISEKEFKEWYRQQLNESELSNTEYRDLTRTYMLMSRLHEYLAARVPTVAEQVHLHIIVLETYEDAEKTRARWEAGEDFADLAHELSTDEQSKEEGGDIGWWPRRVNPWFDQGFNLSVGEVSQTLPSEVGFFLLMVSEKADSREIDEDSLEVLRGKVLDDWLSVATQFHEVSYHGFNNGFDSETHAWINLQLAKMAK